MRNLLKNITVIFLALQILNLSIYNTDFYGFKYSAQTATLAELQELNPVDCLSELVAEDILGMKNVFPETENSKSGKQKGELKHNITFKLFRQDRFATIEAAPIAHHSEYKKNYALFCNNYSYLFYEEINHPPS